MLDEMRLTKNEIEEAIYSTTSYMGGREFEYKAIARTQLHKCIEVLTAHGLIVLTLGNEIGASVPLEEANAVIFSAKAWRAMTEELWNNAT